MEDSIALWKLTATETIYGKSAATNAANAAAGAIVATSKRRPYQRLVGFASID